jgi:putative tricarboxylic transport membrane protein
MTGRTFRAQHGATEVFQGTSARMQLSDRVTGVVVACLGALAFYGGTRQPKVPGQDIGPAVFPMVVGGGLMLCGLLIAIGIGRTFEAPDAVVPGAPPPSRLRGLLALLPPALLVFYVLAVERLGFLPTAALIVGITAVALGAPLRLALPLAVVAPPAVHLVFAKLLRVPLPDGVLPAPW